MTREEFLHVVSQVRPFSDFVYFHVKGEPLMHPDLEYFLQVRKQNSLKVNITTNGTLLLKKGDLLISSDAVRQVNISVHSFSENQAQNDYLDSVINFAKEASQKGIFVVLRLWNLTGMRETDEITKKSISYINRTLCPDADLFSEMKLKRSFTVSKSLFVSFEEQFEWPTLKSEHLKDGYCHGGRDQIAILSNGTVVPCCLDAEGVIDLGNIFKMPFKDIVTGKRLKDICDGFTARRACEILCKKCTFKSRFDIKV
jgi:MoaA/NifB/PqqE/SkfB family radical SAM enzyme